VSLGTSSAQKIFEEDHEEKGALCEMMECDLKASIYRDSQNKHTIKPIPKQSLLFMMPWEKLM